MQQAVLLVVEEETLLTGRDLLVCLLAVRNCGLAWREEEEEVSHAEKLVVQSYLDTLVDRIANDGREAVAVGSRD